MDKAGRWLRASSDRQDELNQEQGIDAYIAARGYDPAKTYIARDKSASKNEHLPLLREALADMAARRINVLVVRNTDRIDRTESLGQILKLAEQYGGRIESVTGRPGAPRASTATGFLPRAPRGRGRRGLSGRCCRTGFTGA